MTADGTSETHSGPALPPAAQRLRQGRLVLAGQAGATGSADASANFVRPASLGSQERLAHLAAYPQASSTLMDTYFRERLEELAEANPRLFASPFALVAVGGYGRSELCPSSDVDVLLLYGAELPPAADEISRGLFHPLWDLGLDLGHGVRSIKDCLRLAREDTQVLTSLLDTRLIAGDEGLVSRFLHEFSERLLHGHARAFGQWVLEHNAARRAEYGDSSGLLEPELKNGLGGLRDVHQVHWLTQVLAAAPSSPGGDPPLGAEDRADLEQDYHFVLNARTALHLAAGRKTDRLVFDLQPQVARALGFTGADPSSDEGATPDANALATGLAVEAFLSRLHQAMTRIRAARQACWMEVFPPAGALSALPPETPPSIVNTPTGVGFRSGVSPTPADFLALYLAAARAARPVSWAALRATRRALAQPEGRAAFAALPQVLSGTMSDTMSGTMPPGAMSGTMAGTMPEILPALVEIFRASGQSTDIAAPGTTKPERPAGGLTRALKSFFAPAKAPEEANSSQTPPATGRAITPALVPAVQSMLDTGLLAALVPEFGPVEHLVQFDDFHIHPVGKHTLEVVRRLAAMPGEGDQWYARVAVGLIENQARFDHLLLAGFCHDLAKPHRDHAGAGADLAEALLRRLGADEATIDDVRFLVREHLTIPKTATRRDLADEGVAARMAEIAGTPERLDMLHLLAVADSQATGPRAWNPWTASLFSELCLKARKLLTAGPLAAPHAVERTHQVREQVLELARRAGSPVSPETAEAFLERMPARAPLVVDAPTLLRHMELVRRFEASMAEDLRRKPGGKGGIGVTEIDAEALPGSRSYRLSIAAPDQPGLFATMAGVLALHDLNILSAEVLTWKHGIALDVFVVQQPPDGLFLDDLWQRIRRAISYALTGKLSLDYRLEQKRTSPLAPRNSAPKGRRKVRVDNEASDFYTLVEVAAPDRLGLLHDLAHTLAAQGLQIHLARIATSAGRIHDTFYVRTTDGMRITDPAQAEEIRKALLHAAK